MSNIDYTVIDQALTGRDTVIARDLKLNLKRVLDESTLAEERRFLAALAIAQSLKYEPLEKLALAELARLAVPAEQIQEARESAAIMGMLNTYYKFRGMVESEEPYKTAGLRMTVFGRPVLGKEVFEQLAFAVSVVNGCPSCIRSHELALRQLGVTTDQIHDLARLASIAAGLAAL